jgi:hypothetical protein
MLVSYAWHHRVALEATDVGAAEDVDDLSIGDFVREFRLRHAIAVSSLLPDVIQAIETRLSHESSLVRVESRGTIRGRLDVPRYLSRRATLRSFPRLYPVVRSQFTYGTPENLLARLGLSESRSALRDNPFTRKTAESVAVGELLLWATDHLRRRPWDELPDPGTRQRLLNETVARVRRRQTGNDHGYQLLLDWFDSWTLDLGRLGDDRRDQLVAGLLALPFGDAFWEKVFEVWCLLLVSNALDALGWQRIDGPKPLHVKGKPIYEYLSSTGDLISVRFQSQSPLPPGVWSYRGGGPLRGIPDISLAAEGGGPPLLIDAKYRLIKSGAALTRSEETYKMLGYAENFRANQGLDPFCAVLIFPADVSQHRVLDGPKHGRIDLVAVEVSGDRAPALNGLVDAIQAWEDVL